MLKRYSNVTRLRKARYFSFGTYLCLTVLLFLLAGVSFEYTTRYWVPFRISILHPNFTGDTVLNGATFKVLDKVTYNYYASYWMPNDTGRRQSPNVFLIYTDVTSKKTLAEYTELLFPVNQRKSYFVFTSEKKVPYDIRKEYWRLTTGWLQFAKFPKDWFAWYSWERPPHSLSTGWLYGFEGQLGNYSFFRRRSKGSLEHYIDTCWCWDDPEGEHSFDCECSDIFK